MKTRLPIKIFTTPSVERDRIFMISHDEKEAELDFQDVGLTVKVDVAKGAMKAERAKEALDLYVRKLVKNNRIAMFKRK